MRFLKLALLCASVLIPAGHALAQQTVPSRAGASQDVTVTISSGDLDLQSGESRAMLEHRIAIAAGRLCTTVTPPAFGDAWDGCRRDSIRDARNQLHAVMIAAGRRVRFALADRR